VKNELEGWNLSIRTSLLPKDTNYHGTIFGGVILSYIDMAGAIEAKRLCRQEVVTVAMDEVVFKKPVFLGDLISFYTRVIGTGRTSVTVEVAVIAVRNSAAESCEARVTNAQVTYVAVDTETRRSTPVKIRASQIDPPAFSSEYLSERIKTDEG